MKNPLKSERFDRHEATKDRSPGFRAFIIFLLLLFSSIIIYTLVVRKNSSQISDDNIATPETIISK